ncbi:MULTISPECIES: diguanylate cyclase [unclassified Acidovorax]|uniref:sensor domain-containing diguanylate cyclase n=1 Tax=unclassified Acidovorax TaxID=2684926 RepID=UPI002882D46D|nr:MULTISPECIES: diguanylate cyclase [unclassified Acidovorax]
MNLPAQPADEHRPRSNPVHWLVRMNRRNRSGFYAMLGLAVSAHLWQVGASPALWAVVIAQFFVYPQLAYWRAVRSARQRHTEMQNLWLDSMFGGLWAGGLGLPLWLSFALIIGNCINIVVFYGARGVPRLMLTVGGGVAAAAAAWQVWTGHWPLHPATDTVTSLLCIGALTVYFFAFAHDGYVRAMDQHRNNEKLRLQFEEIQSLQIRLRDQALRDPLTGLFNRRQLDAVLGSEIERCRAIGAPLSVLMIDIDHFKRVNDSHGHAAGDAVLQVLAQLLQRHARPQDMVCRHGGEEFLVLLADTPLLVAQDRAEALRQAFESLLVPYGDVALAATLSCGVAGFPQHTDQPLALVASADHALYTAKLQGRNRVIVQPVDVH